MSCKRNDDKSQIASSNEYSNALIIRALLGGRVFRFRAGYSRYSSTLLLVRPTRIHISIKQFFTNREPLRTPHATVQVQSAG